MTLITFEGHTPKLADDVFVAPGTRIIGDVEIGAGSSVWYNCVLRADVNRIRIGARTNIQDGTVIHVDSPRGDDGGRPTIIGDDVLIGHMVMLHGSILEDRAFVGLGSVVMDSVIESDGMLAAGALLSPGKVIRSRELWMGRPAKFVRMLSDSEIAGNQLGVAHYVENARRHRAVLGS
jgi:carbonic anhydrase/acetyltransferase-like protein (isoleucine patch superfamily)